MSMGKFLAGFIVIASIVMGAGLYYTQVYAFYDEVAADQVELRLTSLASGQPEPILAENVQAIESNSSPIRFRACFTTPMSLAMLTETYQPMTGAVPLNGPGWFDCYDASEVGAALEAGTATAFLGEANIRDGVDRVIAVFPDGRAYVWHQLNEKYKD